MQFRLKTSKRTEEIYDAIYKSEHLQPFALSKLSISLAIHNNFSSAQEEISDNDGLDLNRQTIMGENDRLFKALIEINEGRYIPEEEYFPEIVKKYIDYGAVVLEQEYKYNHDLYSHLVNIDKGI